MEKPPVHVVAATAVKPLNYVAALVNDSDKTVRPTSHLFLIEDGPNKITTSTMVSVDARFSHLTHDSDGYIYWSGYDGYVITTNPDIAPLVHEATNVSMYGVKKTSLDVNWYMRRICSEDIVFSAQAGCAVLFFTMLGEVIMYTEHSGLTRYEIGVSPKSVCASSESDIYVGTVFGEVFHFNGSQWDQLPFVRPRTTVSAMEYSALVMLPDKGVLALSESGYVARKMPDGDFEMLKAPALKYNGAAWIEDRFFVSAKEGLYEASLTANELVLTLLKDTFSPLSLSPHFGELIMTSSTPRKLAYFAVGKPESNETKISCSAMSIDYRL